MTLHGKFPGRYPNADNSKHQDWLDNAAIDFGQQVAALANVHYDGHSVIWIEVDMPAVEFRFSSQLPDGGNYTLRTMVSDAHQALDDHDRLTALAGLISRNWFYTATNGEENDE